MVKDVIQLQTKKNVTITVRRYYKSNHVYAASDGTVYEILGGKYRKLAQYTDKNGYKLVDVLGNMHKVHRIVAFAWIGTPELGEQCAHLDGDPANNCVTNLVWCSAKDNQSHRVLHGTDIRGIKNGRCKLTEKDVKEIRLLVAVNTLTLDIAVRYNVTQTAINRIKTGKNWKYLK